MRKLFFRLKKRIKKYFKIGFGIKKDFHKQQKILKLDFEDCYGINNKIIIGKDCKIEELLIVIRGNNNLIEIANNNRLGKGSSIWLEGNNLTTKIGENNTFESVHLANTEDNTKLLIGNDCMFSYGIEIRTGDSHSIVHYSNPHNRLNYAKDVIIGDHCWLGANVNILKGVELKSNTIVGIGSVVTKGFNIGNCIIAGIPAEIKKTDINWLRERI